MSRGPVILYVDDDENDQFFVRHTFRKAAPEAVVVSAADGEEAEDYLAGRGAFADRNEHPFPHVVLLDLKLPRKTGFDLLSWMRGEGGLKDLTVIVLSSSKETRDVERAYALGANSYLSKEASLKSLGDVLRGIVALADVVKNGG